MAKNRDVMTKDPVFCQPGDSLTTVANIMKQKDVGSVPVVESGGSRRLVGIITDRDIVVKAIAEGRSPEAATVKDEEGRDATFDLWTTCFTPRELRLLAARSGLTVRDLWSVTPGAYRADPPRVDAAEFLLVAQRG